MIKLLKNVDVYAPNHIGKKDIVLCGNKIYKIQDNLSEYESLKDVEVYDLQGNIVTPGYIDLHVHITGGGGEQGFASRVPEAQLSQLTRYGVTTAVGLLGTDGITRSLENLVAKARALNEEGMTVYSLTSSYGYPPITLTGSVEKDIMMIPPMIGVKIALSDHRSSNPTYEELIRLSTSARRGGLLSGNAGLVTIHMGSSKQGLTPLFHVLDHSDVPILNLLPTHVLRTRLLMEQSMQWIQRGGYVDCTAGNEIEQKKLMEFLAMEHVDIKHVTLSSDAFGSQPLFNEMGECIGLTYSTSEYLHKTIKTLVEHGWKLEKVLCLLTTNPAHILQKDGVKGCVCENADADLLILDENLDIQSVIAKGNFAIRDKEIVLKGRFEGGM